MDVPPAGEKGLPSSESFAVIQHDPRRKPCRRDGGGLQSQQPGQPRAQNLRCDKPHDAPLTRCCAMLVHTLYARHAQEPSSRAGQDGDHEPVSDRGEGVVRQAEVENGPEEWRAWLAAQQDELLKAGDITGIEAEILTEIVSLEAVLPPPTRAQS